MQLQVLGPGVQGRGVRVALVGLGVDAAAVLDRDLVLRVVRWVLRVAAEDGGAGAVEDELFFVDPRVDEYCYRGLAGDVLDSCDCFVEGRVYRLALDG